MPPTSRRSVLALLGSSLTVAAGCTGSPEDSSQRTTATTTTTSMPSKTTTTETATQTETETPRVDKRLSTNGSWTQFQFDASKTGTNVEVSAVPDDGAVYWKRPRGGMPILEGRQIYTVERHDDESVLVQRDLADGTIQRTFRTGGGSQMDWVALGEDAVIAPTERGVVSVDRKTWTENWRVESLDAPGYGPTVSGSTVYISAGTFINDDGVVAAIDATSGETTWKNQVGNTSPVAVDDDFVYYTSGTELVAADATTGETAWRQSWESTVKAHPVVKGDRVFSIDQQVVRCSKRADGTVVWRHPVENGTSNGLAVDGHGSVVYADDEGLSSLDASTGERQWRADIGLAVTPSIGGEAVYAGTVRSPSQFVALDRETGDERWSHQLPETTVEGDVITNGAEGPPAVFDDGVLIRAVDGLYAFGT